MGQGKFLAVGFKNFVGSLVTDLILVITVLVFATFRQPNEVGEMALTSAGIALVIILTILVILGKLWLNGIILNKLWKWK